MKMLLAIWWVVPVAMVAFHYGPGQTALARRASAGWLERARAAEAAEDWSAAVQGYEEALKAAPLEATTARIGLRLAKANARIYVGELPEAMADLELLLSESLEASVPTSAVRAVRASLANAQYYAGWLMRLEGAAKEEWTAPIEQSRQHFRLLAEETERSVPGESLSYQRNLESVIRLARMDLSELAAMPLPQECKNCSNCSQKCRKQRESRQEEPKQEPKDARGAGAGKRPDGSGS